MLMRYLVLECFADDEVALLEIRTQNYGNDKLTTVWTAAKQLWCQSAHLHLGVLHNFPTISVFEKHTDFQPSHL